jgi:hypothetical protein
MSPFNETSHPLIEITISRTALRRCGVVVPLCLLLLLGLVGAASSPLVNGHPVILSRERLALKVYLEEAQDWIKRLEEITVRLDNLSPSPSAIAAAVPTTTSTLSVTLVPTGSLPAQVTLPSQTRLSTFHTPASQPSNLFDRAQAAEHVIQQLQALERDLQQIEMPVAFTGLHGLATDTVHLFATWATQVTDAIGAPTSDTITAAQVSRQTALLTLETLRKALARQQGTQP